MTLRASRRGLVPPFIAMDVLRAATEREAAGADVIHLEVGQPGTPAPEAVREAARRALDDARIGYTDALGISTTARGDRGRIIARNTRSRSMPGEVVVTTGSSAAFQLAFLAAFEAGDRVALAVPGYPAYRNILSALGIEPVLIEVGENTHYQPNPELLAEAGPLDGLIVASPANPTGTMIGADRSGIAVGLLPRARYPPRFGRDLSRYYLRKPGGYGARLQSRGDRRQFVFEILQHDRLAARLDAGPGRSRPLGRMPGAEFLHLAAGPLAARGDPGLRVPRRARRPCRALPRQPRPADRSARGRRPDAVRAGRRRLLPLCRHFRVDAATARNSAGGCWPKPGSRSPPASISTRSAAATGCACRLPARPGTSPKPRAASRIG